MYYFIEFDGNVKNTADVKAPSDICHILRKRGYKPVKFKSTTGKNRIRRKLTGCANWSKLFCMIDSRDVLLIQYPHALGYITIKLLKQLKKLKKINLCVLVHDIDSLRGHSDPKKNRLREQFLRESSDQIICHNEAMKKWLIDQGVPSEKIIPLEIFDYIYDGKYTAHEDRNSIIIAGNLNPEKSLYISEYISMHRDYFLNLYGPNFIAPENGSNYTYYGSFPPDELPSHLHGAYGLVWDGDSVEECNGMKGNYLKYNNPHKTSLYIAIGIPVIIWEKAALARYVLEKNVGFTVSNLNEIQEKLAAISRNRYEDMCKNAVAEGKKLREGYYLNQALDKMEHNLNLSGKR